MRVRTAASRCSTLVICGPVLCFRTVLVCSHGVDNGPNDVLRNVNVFQNAAELREARFRHVGQIAFPMPVGAAVVDVLPFVQFRCHRASVVCAGEQAGLLWYRPLARGGISLPAQQSGITESIPVAVR